jgi:hypothetical protein
MLNKKFCRFLRGDQPRFALILARPRNDAFSSRARRGDSTSPRKVAPGSRTQRSDANTFPSIVPWIVTDFTLTSPRMRALLPTISAPVALILPFTLPSIWSSLRKLKSPSIDTSLERKPRAVGVLGASACRSALVGDSSGDAAGPGESSLLDPNMFV